ncbi:hypothetical protein GA0061102_101518 [Rhizobium miluonense]|uniref:Uncharacterized protein n=1 Tax=Rhizobium miluonense TaxID=411945 RepID=A0A1C3VMH1_9HYPH|nr:hypothetical protein GA0061102_101518 [Rhizobium miluonense]
MIGKTRNNEEHIRDSIASLPEMEDLAGELPYKISPYRRRVLDSPSQQRPISGRPPSEDNVG